MATPSMRSVFLFESPGGRWLTLTELYNTTKAPELVILPMIREMLSGKVREFVRGHMGLYSAIEGVEKRILAGDVEDAVRAIDDVQRLCREQGELGENPEERRAFGAIFVDMYRYIMQGHDPLRTFARHFGSVHEGRVFSAGRGGFISKGEWDTPKKVGQDILVAGDFIIETKAGHFERAWLVDQVADDPSAPPQARVAADQALEAR